MRHASCGLRAKWLVCVLVAPVLGCRHPVALLGPDNSMEDPITADPCETIPLWGPSPRSEVVMRFATQVSWPPEHVVESEVDHGPLKEIS